MKTSRILSRCFLREDTEMTPRCTEWCSQLESEKRKLRQGGAVSHLLSDYQRGKRKHLMEKGTLCTTDGNVNWFLLYYHCCCGGGGGIAASTGAQDLMYDSQCSPTKLQLPPTMLITENNTEALQNSSVELASINRNWELEHRIPMFTVAAFTMVKRKNNLNVL